MSTDDATQVPTAMIRLWERGEETVGTALGRLVDEDFRGPSLLPGWTRAHVLAHLARNADAVLNLLTWARTGVETPMYPSRQVRDEQIEQTAQGSPDELRGDVISAAARLAEAVRGMPPAAWAATVRNARGQEIPGADIMWMRTQETWVHAVDLDSGVGFADLPEPVLARLVDEVFAAWEGRDETPAVVVFAGDREWGSGDAGVSGSLADVAAWVTGRSSGDGLRADAPLPPIPRWV